ncbi:MAG: carbohydrate kinase family protein [Gemmatimonadales bacterium]|jgi:hypothetical protein
MKCLGVVGTMVWDTIYGRGGEADPIEEWGGIAYALAALDAALPDHWRLVPLVKVGRDLASKANTFLESLAHRSAAQRFVEVPEPNNRVTLHYDGLVRRAERLTGGVPAWTWAELGPMLRDLDALYVNFISGFELTLETMQYLRRGFDGPVYVDLHSLLLGVARDGSRTPQRLPQVSEWFACCDVVQLNEDELALIGDDPMAVAASAMRVGVGLMLVTLAERGAVYFTVPPFRFGREPSRATAIRTRRLDTPRVDAVDPTGSGDVFGGTVVAGLVADLDVETAIERATAAAARNVQYRGATGLQYHLRGEIVPQ